MQQISYYRLYLSIHETILKAHNLNESSISSYKNLHIKHRAYFLMKFDELLALYRRTNNSKADHLHGINAAVVMCCEKLKISPIEVRKFTLNDIITTLHTDINNLKLSSEVLNEIINPYNTNLGQMEIIEHQLGPFIDAEWDPELRYRLIASSNRTNY